MFNFNYINNAKFRPFSYQEMLQPLQAYTNEYNTIQEGIGELGAKADMLNQIANEQTEPHAYAMYKQYADDLTRQAESLAKQGLTPESRQGLLDLRRRYSSEILPIQSAFSRRQQFSDEERQARLKDSTIMYDRPASTISLDELIANPALTPKSYSGELIAKQVGTAAQNLARELRTNPRRWKSILQNQYFETKLSKGYSVEEILLTAAGDLKAPKELRSIVDDVIRGTGILDWQNRDAINNAYAHARRGLWSALGDTQYQQVANRGYEYERKNKMSGEQLPPKHYRSIGQVEVHDLDTRQMEIDKALIAELEKTPGLYHVEATRPIKGSKYVLADPQSSYAVPIGGGETIRTEKYYPYQERLKELKERWGDKMDFLTDDQKVIPSKAKEFKDYIDTQIKKSAIRRNQYIVDITDPSLISKNLRENIQARSADNDYTGVYELKKGRKGSAVDLEDVNEYFTDKGHIRYSPSYGIVYTGTNSKGKTRSFVLDPEVVTGQTVIDKNTNKRRNQYSMVLEAIDQAIESNDEKAQEYYIDLLLNDIYSRFNSISKIQPKTLTAKEESGG